MKPKSNEALVAHMMRFSEHGALAQMFIIDAISKAADRVVNAGLPEVRKQFGENAMIHPDAWYGVAKEIKEKMAANYGWDKRKEAP